uniref:Centriolar satellite-associated tubulin polyglutamylase complex regulator 1 n=1 Tax=Pipistrellus kuhlii TaxID=59472 RepID=A0A7J7WYV9_PIPKU|nr:hypothetical protein mPipKuh1_001635 [Pipistrellus kuhlii]
MMLSPERLALPDYEYLAQRHVLTYMEDAVCQLLENKEDVSQYGIARFFTEYFNSVCQGTHILFREFSFIQATPHNRASFLRAFWRCFRTVGKNGDLLTMKEYHCLLQLLCPDFPLELTQKAARYVFRALEANSALCGAELLRETWNVYKQTNKPLGKNKTIRKETGIWREVYLGIA